MPPVPNVVVGVGVWIERLGDDGYELLMLERAGSDGAGTWSIPGGWLEFGEQAEDAAVREVKEETGLDIIPNDDRFSGFVTVASDDGERWITTLLVKAKLRDANQEPCITEPDKCPQVRWVPFDGVRDLPLFAPLADLLDREPFWLDGD